MQSTLKQESHPKHFGGIFAPLAQYPGASYAKLLAEKIEQDMPAIPRQKSQKKIYVRSTAKEIMTKVPFKIALLLVDMESNAVLDRAALRDAGIVKVQVLTSGVQAAKLLNASLDSNNDARIDIVFCHPRFEDMSAAQWIELIRSHPALKNLPVVSLVGSLAEEKLLHAVSNGFDDSLTRPYSPKALQEKLLRISHLHKEEPRVNLPSQAFDASLLRFESRKTEDGKAAFNMEEGLRAMTNKQWDVAIQSFTKAMLHPNYKGDAELGLAAAWRGSQDLEKFRYYLYEASLTFTREAKWVKARSAYGHVLKAMPKTPSPFIRTMQSLIRAAKYTEAHATIVAGLDLSAHENIASRIAKACLYTENPPFTLKKVKEHFTDPTLKDIVKDLDGHLQQAFTTHQGNVAKAREDRAKLEQKARAYLAKKDSNTKLEKDATPLVAGPAVALGFEQHEEKDFSDNNKVEAKSILEDIPGEPTLIEDDYVKQNGTSNVLPLMDEDDLESQLFSGFPGLNEAATVIKTTWKLMKK